MPRAKPVVLARAEAIVERGGGTATFKLRPTKRAKRLLARHAEPVPTRLLVSIVDGAGNESVLTAKVRIGRSS